MRLHKTIGMIVVFSIWLSTAFAQPDRLEQLQQKVETQQKAIQELEQQVANQDSSANQVVAESLTQPDTTDGKVVAGYNKGFFIQTADGDLLLRINGYIRHHFMISERHTVQDNTYVLADNRLDIHMYYKKDWHVRLRPTLDTALPGGNVGLSLKEAYIEYLGFPSAQFRIGAFLTPFTMLGNTNPADFLAVPLPPYLTSYPLRDVGFMMFGDGIPLIGNPVLADYFSYAIGVFNGDGETRLSFTDDVMVVGQALIYPLTHQNKNVFFWIAAFANETSFRNTGARIRLAALQNHLVFPSATTPTIDDTNGNQLGVCFGFRHWQNNLRIELEYMWIRYDRDHDVANGILTDREPLEMWGISLGLSYFFALPELGLGDKAGVEPLFRLSYTTIDDQHGDGSGYGVKPFGTATDVNGQNIWEVIFGIKFHFNQYLRMDFNWIMYDLAETSSGLTNSERGEGGGIMHAFMFQWVASW